MIKLEQWIDFDQQQKINNKNKTKCDVTFKQSNKME